MEKIECGGCAPPVLVAGSRSRLDEAVEVARLAYEVEVDGQVYSPNVPADAMRAALLAGVKVLLGEPVGYVARCEIDSHANVRKVGSNFGGTMWSRPTGSAGIPLYAPSLGEGDGR